MKLWHVMISNKDLIIYHEYVVAKDAHSAENNAMREFDKRSERSMLGECFVVQSAEISTAHGDEGVLYEVEVHKLF